jgi:uncharacterized delta-60 repeat protein
VNRTPGRLACLFLAIISLLSPLLTQAQMVPVGGIARDFEMIDRATGKRIRLHDFKGHVILLDFFAYWCGPCRWSAPQVEQDIAQYYEKAGANPHGVPVKVISVNIQEGYTSETDRYIAETGVSFAVDDIMNEAFSQFAPPRDAGIPMFVVINGVEASPSHAQWQVLSSQSGYAGAYFYRDVIDSVKKGSLDGPAVIYRDLKPTITAAGKPLSADILVGGSGPYRFDWIRNGAALATTDIPSFSVADPGPKDSGFYSVRVSNGLGETPGVPALFWVQPPQPDPGKWIAEHPATTAATLGKMVVLTVKTTVPGLSLQWRRNGMNLPGQTNTQITLGPIQQSDSGIYSVLVSGAGETLESHPALVSVNSTGGWDIGFGPDVTREGTVRSIAVQKDGRIVIGGDFTRVNGRPVRSIARIHPDGSLDDSFEIGSGVDGDVNDIELLPDGRIMVVGSFSRFDGMPVRSIVRLLPSGRLDPAFHHEVGVDGGILDVQADPQGRLWIAGYFRSVGSKERPNLARMTPDGLLDTNAMTAGAPNYQVSEVRLFPNGKLLIRGYFNEFGSSSRTGVAVLSGDGHLDMNFPFTSSYGSYIMQGIEILDDNSFLVSGYLGTLNGVESGKLAVVRSNSVQPLSAPNLYSPGRLQHDSNGDILIAGWNSVWKWRRSSDSKIFSLATDLVGSAFCLHPSGGTVLVGGSGFRIQNTDRGSLLRLGPTGVPELTPAPDIRVPGTIKAMRYRSSGELVIAGDFNRVADKKVSNIAVLGTSGQLDPLFNPGLRIANGTINSLHVYPDNRILIAGNFSGVRTGLALLNPDGSLNTSFGNGNSFDSAYDVRATVLDNGRILVAGSFDRYGTTPSKGLALLEPNGLLVPGFKAPLINGYVTDLVPSPGGEAYVLGRFTSVNNQNRTGMIRLTSEGIVDTEFWFQPTDGTYQAFNSATVLEDGSVVVVGYFSSIAGQKRNGIARISRDGLPMPGFDSGSTYNYYRFITRDSSGRIYIGSQNSAIRMKPDGSPDLSYRFAVDLSFRGNAVECGSVSPHGDLMLGGRLLTVNSQRVSGPIRTFADEPASQELHWVSEPSSQPIGLGSAVELQVEAAGGWPLLYYWYHDGKMLDISPYPVLRIPGFGEKQSGDYRVQVVSPVGELWSQPFRLTSVTTPQDPFTSWVAGQGYVSGKRGAEDDGDGDGIANIMEFAIPDLRVDGGCQPISLRTTHLGIEVSYTSADIASDVEVILEASSDLINWKKQPVQMISKNTGLTTFGSYWNPGTHPAQVFRLRCQLAN